MKNNMPEISTNEIQSKEEKLDLNTNENINCVSLQNDSSDIKPLINGYQDNNKALSKLPFAIRTTKVTTKNFKSQRIKRSISSDEDYKNSEVPNSDYKKFKSDNAEITSSKIIHKDCNTELNNSTQNATVGENNSIHNQVSNLSNIYKNLLNGDTHEDKDNAKNGIKKKLRQINRKDLEEMIIEQFINKLFYDHELGQQRSLCERLETTLEAANKKAMQLTKEVMLLKDVTGKLSVEHNKRKNQVIIPFKLKRSVGIQANETYINEGIYASFLDPSNTRVIIPSKYKRRSQQKSHSLENVTTNLLQKTKKLSGVLKQESDAQKSAKGVKDSVETKRINSKGNQTTDVNDCPDSSSSNLLINDLATKKLKKGRQPETLPPLPKKECVETSSDIVLPRPTLSVQLRNKCVLLDIDVESNVSSVMSFQLFAFVESKEEDLFKWNRICNIKAFKLPMTYKLTKMKTGQVYHFIIRALNKDGSTGSFSRKKRLFVPP